MPMIHKLFRAGMNPRVSRLVKDLKKEEILAYWKIVKGDKVMVTEGKEKGKSGLVVEVQRKRNTVKIENLNLAKKAVPKSETSPQGIMLKEMPIHVSNVALIDPLDGLPTRVKINRHYNEDTKKYENRRISVRTGTYIPKPKYLEYQSAWADGKLDTSAEEVEKVTYFPQKNTKPMPTALLYELANRRGSII